MEVGQALFWHLGQSVNLLTLFEPGVVAFDNDPGVSVLLDCDSVSQSAKIDLILFRDGLGLLYRLFELFEAIFEVFVYLDNFGGGNDFYCDGFGRFRPVVRLAVSDLEFDLRGPGPVFRRLVLEVSLANLVFGERIAGIEDNFFFLACDDLEHHSAGIELVTDDDHIRDHQGDDGEQPGGGAVSSADDFGHREGLDIAGADGDEGQQYHTDEGPHRQEEGGHSDFVCFAGVADDGACADPDGEHRADHNPGRECAAGDGEVLLGFDVA